MKRIFAFFLVLSVFALASCAPTVPTEEPFTSDFTYKDQSFETTSIVFDPDYIGETHVFNSNAVSFSDIKDFCESTLFFEGSDTLSMLSSEIKVALSGQFNSEDTENITEISAILNGVSSFPGISEVSVGVANVIINFTNNEDFVCHRDPYGFVTGADISIPVSLSATERRSLICKYLFKICGFLGVCDTPLDSVIAPNGADSFTDTDLLILEALYSTGNTDMSKNEFISALKNYFITNSSEVLS